MIFPFVMSSCGLFSKSGSSNKKILKELDKYPNIKGYKKSALPNSKIFLKEVFVGKEMLVDCNYHSIQGKFDKKEKNKKSFYIFNSNGDVASTMMACPNGKKEKKFVYSEALFLSISNRFEKNKLDVIYAPSDFEVKFRLWRLERLKSFLKENKKIDEDSRKYLTYYPSKIENYKREVIHLPKIETDYGQEYKVEVILHFTDPVAPAEYTLSSQLAEKTIEGMGFSYYVFSFKNKGEKSNLFLDYNSNLPIVIFIPKNMKLEYRIWSTDRIYRNSITKK